MTMPNPNTFGYQLYDRHEYYKDLCRRIDGASAGSRVLVATMAFMPGDPEIAPIVTSLEKASRRGVATAMITDAYDYLVNEDEQRFGPLVFHGHLPAALPSPEDTHRKTILRMRRAGVQCVVTNLPSRVLKNPYGGRSHIKTAIIDDYLYVGGCNFHHPNDLDVMVGWRDHRTANWLYREMQKILVDPYTTRALGSHDQSFVIDPHTQLLLDSGVKRQSVIMRNAFEVIDNAQVWLVITSQFFPDSAGAHLARALQRGVKVYTIFNNSYQFAGLNYWVHQTQKRWAQLRLPAALFEYELGPDLPFLHAKILASEQEAMVGSHNYLKIGVTFGTTELTIRRKDPVFSRDLTQHILGLTNLEKTIILPS